MSLPPVFSGRRIPHPWFVPCPLLQYGSSSSVSSRRLCFLVQEEPLLGDHGAASGDVDGDKAGAGASTPPLPVARCAAAPHPPPPHPNTHARLLPQFNPFCRGWVSRCCLRGSPLPRSESPLVHPLFSHTVPRAHLAHLAHFPFHLCGSRPLNMECAVCLTNTRDVLLRPCRHVPLCFECSQLRSPVSPNRCVLCCGILCPFGCDGYVGCCGVSVLCGSVAFLCHSTACCVSGMGVHPAWAPCSHRTLTASQPAPYVALPSRSGSASLFRRRW